ncbi:MAG: hypothetical protein ACRDJW_08330 [Thermomicrobiales bacterium]
MQPSDEVVVGRALHARMVAGDPIASTEMAERYIPVLTTYMKGYRARKDLFSADDDDLWDAAVEAIQSYLEKPVRYDPTKGKSLAGYLKMAAEGDLKNILDKRRLPDGVFVVPQPDDDWNSESADPSDVIAGADERISEDELFERVVWAAETDEERIVLALLLSGERSNAVFAERLGRPNPTAAEVTKEMNQIKDRLCKRLKRRYAGRTRDATSD